MAIFGKSKKEEVKKTPAKEIIKKETVKAEKPKAEKKATKVVAPVVADSASLAIVRPRITEKSGILSQGGVYTFEIANNANKDAVAKAMNALYKVKPVKVAIVNLPSKNVFVRGKKGTVSGIRKAVVTLKKGDKIDFI